MPKPISIITICYNNFAGLLRTAKSILEQTQRQQIEWIVVDGLSTDQTVQWLQQNKQQIDVLICEKDSGIYNAMNKGLRAATGNYVWFVNSGDALYQPQVIEQLLPLLQTNSQLYYSDTMYIDMQGNELGLYSKLKPHKFPLTINRNTFRFGMNFCHQSTLISRAIAPEYNEQYRIAADIDWVLQVLSTNPSYTLCPFILSAFETGGTSKQQQQKAWKERFAIMAHYYGTVTTAAAHVLIVIRKVLFSLFKIKTV